MRKMLLTTALVLTSAAAQAQTMDLGSILSANGISLGQGAGQQPQLGGQGQMQGQGGSALPGMSQSAVNPGGQSAAGQGQSQRQAAGRNRQPRESATETRARRIAAKYGISW